MKSESKKIIIFALVLLILAGIIVVVLKGFNVSLSLRAHDTLKYSFNQKFEQSDIENICNEVFGDQEYQIKTVTVFTDKIYVMSPSITDEQKQNLTSKFYNLYKTEDVEKTKAEETEDKENSEKKEEGPVEGTDYEFYTDAKVRVRDIVKPYVLPSIVSAVIVLVYVAIKYKKLNNGKFYITVAKVLLEMIVILLALLSIIAITRIPFQATVIPILIFIMLVCLVVKFARYEKKLKEMEEE